ncbi:hypothetical protein [Mailhella sp.]|uniref:hypothetical protein n=1 Tax=Mailhella sp. TaxID=1981029 RepID=UPI004062D0F4
MPKHTKVAEYTKHLEVIHKRKSDSQIAEEQIVHYMVERNLMEGYELEDWEEKERAILRADESHKAEVERSFEALRGRLSVEACLEECASLLQCAKDKASGKSVEFAEPVAGLAFLESENVTREDVELAAACEREVIALIDDLKARIARNEEAAREAVARIGGDETLNKKLRKLEAQRKKALLAGSDLSKFNAEIMSLRHAIEENKLAVGIAEADVETLKEHCEALGDALSFVREVAEYITAKASALYAHSKVAELNAKTAELASLTQEVAEAKERTLRNAGFVRQTLCQAPTCDVPEIVFPMWRGRRSVPDFKGGIKADDVRLLVKVRF